MAAQKYEFNGELKELLEAIRTAVVFSGTGAPGRPAAGPSLEDDLDRVLAEVLGWKGRPDDTAGFVAALKQAFEVKQDDDGVTTVKLRPRTVTQASLAAVTGFRATVLAQAKATIEQTLALLDGLQPLLADADPQDVEAVRSTIRSRIVEVGEELGSASPRVDRLDVLFESLVGPAGGSSTLNLLNRLEEVLGLELERAKTIQEELMLTNFLVLRSLLETLAALYHEHRGSFEDEGDDFLGSQLGLLAEELALVVESVQELVAALESVAFGAAERRAADLKDHSITLDELLTWIDDFASDEGPALLRDGGRDMVGPVFVPTLERLRELADAAAEPDGVEGLTEAHRAGLVDLSFATLRDHLVEALVIAERIAAPSQRAKRRRRRK